MNFGDYMLEPDFLCVDDNEMLNYMDDLRDEIFEKLSAMEIAAVTNDPKEFRLYWTQVLQEKYERNHAL